MWLSLQRGPSPTSSEESVPRTVSRASRSASKLRWGFAQLSKLLPASKASRAKRAGTPLGEKAETPVEEKVAMPRVSFEPRLSTNTNRLSVVRSSTSGVVSRRPSLRQRPPPPPPTISSMRIMAEKALPPLPPGAASRPASLALSGRSISDPPPHLIQPPPQWLVRAATRPKAPRPRTPKTPPNKDTLISFLSLTPTPRGKSFRSDSGHSAYSSFLSLTPTPPRKTSYQLSPWRPTPAIRVSPPGDHSAAAPVDGSEVCLFENRVDRVLIHIPHPYATATPRPPSRPGRGRPASIKYEQFVRLE